jgi:hypothetical protein
LAAVTSRACVMGMKEILTAEDTENAEKIASKSRRALRPRR